MVVKTNGSRPFQRTHNGVLIYLQLDDWPADMPLPGGVTLGETGEGPFYPYWDLILKSDQTIQVVVGWFIIPLTLNEAITWYQTEMAKQGWAHLAEKSSRLSESAVLRFEQPTTSVRAVVDLHVRPHNQTDAFIRRVIKHPWPLADEQPVPADVSQPTEAEALRPREAAVPVPA